MEEGERIVLWPHRKAASPCGRSAALESRPLTRRPGREGRRPSGRLTEPASPRHKALVSGPLQPRSKARLPFCRHYWKSRVAAADGRCQASCRGQRTRPRCGIAAVARGDPPPSRAPLADHADGGAAPALLQCACPGRASCSPSSPSSNDANAGCRPRLVLAHVWAGPGAAGGVCLTNKDPPRAGIPPITAQS